MRHTLRQTLQRLEIDVVRTQPAQQLPDPLDGIELGTVGRQKIQAQTTTMPIQKRLQLFGVMVRGIVRHDHHRPARAAMAPKHAQKGLEAEGIEDGDQQRNQTPVVQIDRPEQRDRPARGSLQNRRILIFGRDPHPTACTVLFEMAFVQAPQVNPFVGG